MKKSPMLHDCAFCSKSEMICCFVDVYTINRTLHGRLEIQNLPSCVEKYFMSQCNEHSESENFVSPCGHAILSMYFVFFCMSNEEIEKGK